MGFTGPWFQPLEDKSNHLQPQLRCLLSLRHLTLLRDCTGTDCSSRNLAWLQIETSKKNWLPVVKIGVVHIARSSVGRATRTLLHLDILVVHRESLVYDVSQGVVASNPVRTVAAAQEVVPVFVDDIGTGTEHRGGQRAERYSEPNYLQGSKKLGSNEHNIQIQHYDTLSFPSLQKRRSAVIFHDHGTKLTLALHCCCSFMDTSIADIWIEQLVQILF